MPFDKNITRLCLINYDKISCFKHILLFKPQGLLFGINDKKI
jgi:hypothetical protein